MKNPTRLTFLVLFLFLWNTAFSQAEKELAPGYYLVVAAYSPSQVSFASRYRDLLISQGRTADYGFYPKPGFIYVYLSRFDDLQQSVRAMLDTRKQQEFSKAWVRIIRTSADTEITPVVASTPPVQAEAALSPQQEEKPADTRSPSQEAPEPSNPGSYDDVTDNPPIVQHDHMTLGNTEVFLSLFNASNNRIVEGTVKVVDTDKSKLIREMKGNDYLYLPDPGNRSGKLTLICEAFGYRKVQHEISYPLPLADTIQDHVDLMGTTFIVYFDLIRYHKGDIATLYHVYFYNDAAVMLPESKFELTSLLEMMQEDPGYRIRLHGHTNGNYHGRIIKMGASKNFFSLTGSQNTTGSAKDLARARAEVIRDFLVANGIDGSRIEIKSWGGKKPIYDKHSANARKNVRVEVEILQE